MLIYSDNHFSPDDAIEWSKEDLFPQDLADPLFDSTSANDTDAPPDIFSLDDAIFEENENTPEM